MVDTHQNHDPPLDAPPPAADTPAPPSPPPEAPTPDPPVNALLKEAGLSIVRDWLRQSIVKQDTSRVSLVEAYRAYTTFPLPERSSLCNIDSFLAEILALEGFSTEGPSSSTSPVPLPPGPASSSSTSPPPPSLPEKPKGSRYHLFISNAKLAELDYEAVSGIWSRAGSDFEAWGRKVIEAKLRERVEKGEGADLSFKGGELSTGVEGSPAKPIKSEPLPNPPPTKPGRLNPPSIDLPDDMFSVAQENLLPVPQLSFRRILGKTPEGQGGHAMFCRQTVGPEGAKVMAGHWLKTCLRQSSTSSAVDLKTLRLSDIYQCYLSYPHHPPRCPPVDMATILDLLLGLFPMPKPPATVGASDDATIGRMTFDGIRLMRHDLMAQKDHICVWQSIGLNFKRQHQQKLREERAAAKKLEVKEEVEKNGGAAAAADVTARIPQTQGGPTTNGGSGGHSQRTIAPAPAPMPSSLVHRDHGHSYHQPAPHPHPYSRPQHPHHASAPAPYQPPIQQHQSQMCRPQQQHPYQQQHHQPPPHLQHRLPESPDASPAAGPVDPVIQWLLHEFVFAPHFVITQREIWLAFVRYVTGLHPELAAKYNNIQPQALFQLLVGRFNCSVVKRADGYVIQGLCGRR